ncbi:hypothetical protein VIGAN_UM164700, partial [Vigna angularis var. angularis]
LVGEEEGKREEFGKLKRELWVLPGGEIPAAISVRGVFGAAFGGVKELLQIWEKRRGEAEERGCLHFGMGEGAGEQQEEGSPSFLPFPANQRAPVGSCTNF